MHKKGFWKTVKIDPLCGSKPLQKTVSSFYRSNSSNNFDKIWVRKIPLSYRQQGLNMSWLLNYILTQ